jgi:hypothetical protein
VRFLRQLAAAATVVGVVVLLGLAWNRFAPSLPGEGPAGRAFAVRGKLVKALPPGVTLSPGGRIVAGGKPPPGARRVTRNGSGSGTPDLDLGDLLKPVNLVVLRGSALLEAEVIAGVVIINASYRRLRRSRHAKAGPPPPGAADLH